MMKKMRVALAMCVLFTTTSVPIMSALGAGGTIEGKITNPRGADVAGATVTATDVINNQTFTAIADGTGRYKIEGLPAGNYSIAVTASGFADFLKEGIRVDEGVAISLDFRLEIAAVEASVVVSTGLRANADPVYQSLRQQARAEEDFSKDYASVNSLTLEREGAKFTLRSGEMYFLAPVAGRVTGAVFIGEGELTLVPPIEAEKNSLKIFTGEPQLTEQFSALIIRFTDSTFTEVSSSPNVKMAQGGPRASQARSMFRDNQELMRKRLRDNRELRTLSDLYAAKQPGYFNAFIKGNRFNKLIYLYDPMGIPEVSPEEVALLSYGETDGGVWTAFHKAGEYKSGTASSSEDHRIIDITHHQIDGSIKGTRITAKDTISFRALVPDRRVIPLNLYRTLRVSRVEDEHGKELHFVQENKNEDSDLGIILPAAMETGRTYKISVHYDGLDALRDSGGGNFILIPRSSWYPNNAGTQFGDRAIFNMTFRYPKAFVFVGSGTQDGSDIKEGDAAIAKWTSGTTELAVAGFNYGRFKKKELADKETGYNIEFYANEQVPDELRAIQLAAEGVEESALNTNMLGSISTSRMGDMIIGDAQNSTRIYNSFFGKLPYTRIAMSQQPAATFGQAWPTLIFMPYTAYMDSTQRVQLMGIRGGTDTFWRYVAPHELAHQWWGHLVGWDSYRDQWMSEGFAEFSASLYVQATKGTEKFLDFWEEQRKRIVEPSPRTRDRKPFTVGPITQGYRLNSAKTGAAYQSLVYPKGAYILHMLRMMMYDARQGGDARFQKMMKDFIKTHYNQDVSTEDFQRIVEKHMTPEMDIDKNGKMNWFFDEWVYGTDVPAYKFEHQIANDGTLSARVTQSGVSDKFVMIVPVYLDFGKGWTKLGTVILAGNSSVDLNGIKLPSKPKRAGICVLNDVLATSIQGSK